jgi:cell division protein FtsI (penicillin-binding protein 3)
MKPGPRRTPVLDRPSVRRRSLLVLWLLVGGFLLFRTTELQLVQGQEWRALAEQQHRARGEVAAPRGAILDRSGIPLALSHEAFRIGVAPHELTDRDQVSDQLMEVLGLTTAQARRLTHSDRRWVQLPDRYPPAAREALQGTRGVYVERELRRSYPHSDLARGILGAVVDESGSGGIEQELEPFLRGMPGSRIVARDSEGRPIPGESWVVAAPVSGGDAVLTLDRDLQEIAREALQNALEETGARGGDLIVTDPRSGEILAMVSLKDGSANHLGGINTPYEPGSTLKPFTVASLLRMGRVSMADSVDTADGRWRVAGRTITDVSAVGKVSLAHALRVSSNVGIARVAERLSPAEQFEGLRDFGFGVPTGIQLPGEASGTLRNPRGWSRQSPASLAIGYEIAVTPLQMTMAYGALANGGLLMEPRILRELRAPDGRVLERFEPRVVRRVMDPAVAGEVNRALVEAVEDGTGTRARLASFAVAGKSGTSRATGPGGAYEVGAYYSSFVGFFPADDPQLVVFVKLDRPRGVYYGGATAAPVTRATMEAVLAARRPPLDRRALAAIARSQEEARVEALRQEQEAQRVARGEAPSAGGSSPLVLASTPPTSRTASVLSLERSPDPFWEAGPRPRNNAAGGADGSDGADGANGADEDAAGVGETGIPGVTGNGVASERRPVVGLPDLTGLSPRTAARRLHAAGLVVEWEGQGPVRSTRPAPGALLNRGDTVRVISDGGRSRR